MGEARAQDGPQDEDISEYQQSLKKKFEVLWVALKAGAGKEMFLLGLKRCLAWLEVSRARPVSRG